MTNKILFFSVVILLAACQTRNSTITEDDRKQLRHIKEVEWPKAYREQDTVLLGKILGDDFTLIDADGNWSDKKSEMDWVHNNAWTTDSFRFEIKRFDFLENGTAIISGTGHIDGDSSKTIYQSSNFFIKRGGVWKAVASHVSGVREEKL